MHALISIHDVMPATLGRVQRLTEKLSHLDKKNITLLVVPGLNWNDQQVDSLRDLENQGFVLSGHGWHHTTKSIRGIYHRLHSTLISRKAAEHLSLDRGAISQLLQDCFQWFEDNKLSSPDLYVPPAWAMGKISMQDFKNSPFRYFENTSGIYDCQTGQHLKLPLVGFEADTMFRQTSLTCWNSFNKLISSKKRPLRISIHPHDAELLLSKSLDNYLQLTTEAVHYRSIW